MNWASTGQHGLPAVAQYLDVPLAPAEAPLEAEPGPVPHRGRRPGVERWWQSLPEISDKLTKEERAEYGIVQRGFWNTLERTIKKNGHDGIVYSNQAEGPGDSYVIFDPKKVTPRFGPQ